jgi:hypothetical protein
LSERTVENHVSQSCTNWAAAPVPRWPAGTPAGPLIRTASRAGSGRHAGPSPTKPGGVLGSAADWSGATTCAATAATR